MRRFNEHVAQGWIGDLFNDGRVLFLDVNSPYVNGAYECGGAAIDNLLTASVRSRADMILIGDISGWPRWTGTRTFYLWKCTARATGAEAIFKHLTLVGDAVEILKFSNGRWPKQITMSGHDILMLKMILAGTDIRSWYQPGAD